MLRNESTFLSFSRLARWSLVHLGLVALLDPQAALGHTLLISQGEVALEECGASVELEIAVEDFVHWYGVGPDSQGDISTEAARGILERHALALHRIFVIRDAAGIPLPSEPFGFHLDWPSENRLTFGELRSQRARYSTRFSYPCAPRFLTFQLLMGADTPSVYWQAILGVHGMKEEGSSVVRLTSRGNAETIELRWSDKHARLAPTSGLESSCAAEGVGGLKHVCADIDVQMEFIEVQIAIPLSLIPTWFVPAGNDDEFLDPEEQKSARGQIEALLTDALIVENEGRRYSGALMEMAFLPLDADNLDSHGEVRRVCMLTGRVSARIRFGPFASLEQADFQWNLFNNAVLSVTAMIGDSGSPVRHEFSTYRPRYHWQRGS